jgi:NodT family efflux transporter outer membrane factor (OMF) lipoprotein
VLRAQQDKNALAVLVGRLPESLNIPDPSADLANMVAPNVVPGLPSGLLERRPDVAEAEANLIAAHENINAARAALFPDITLSVEGGYESAVLSGLFKPGGEFFNLGAGLTQPIFHAGALTGAIKLEKALYDEQMQNYGKAVISAFADTENSLAANTQNIEQLKDDVQVVQTAQHAYDLSNQQFNAGIVDITTVLNTQRSLFSAQDALAQEQLVRLQAAVSVYTSLGGGWKQN